MCGIGNLYVWHPNVRNIIHEQCLFRDHIGEARVHPGGLDGDVHRHFGSVLMHASNGEEFHGHINHVSNTSLVGACWRIIVVWQVDCVQVGYSNYSMINKWLLKINTHTRIVFRMCEGACIRIRILSLTTRIRSRPLTGASFCFLRGHPIIMISCSTSAGNLLVHCGA